VTSPAAGGGSDRDVLAGTMRAISAAMNAEHYDEARRLAQEASRTYPGQPAPWQVLAVIALREHDHAAAEQCLARSAAIDPDGWTLRERAQCLWRLGRLDEAAACARQAIALEPGSAAGHLGEATVLHALRCFDDALAAADAAARLDPGSAYAAARSGASLFALGRYDEACAAFARAAASDARLAHCLQIRVDEASWRALDRPTPLAAEAPRIVHDERPPGGADFVVLVSCDARYLAKYGTAFIEALLANGGARARLHLHVMDPDGGLDAVRARLAAARPSAGAVVTAQASPAAVQGAATMLRTYYSCARFLHLPRWLAAHAMPVVLLDIDAIVERPLDKLVRFGQGADVVLVGREPPDSPWLDIIANRIVACPTAPAAAYFRRVASYVGGYLTGATAAWHLDQIALRCVLAMSERFGEPPAVRWMPQELQDAIWHLGNVYDRLMRTERFQRWERDATRPD